MSVTKRLRSLLRWMPDAWKAKLKYHFDPSFGKEFGGPFNGQKLRRQIFIDLSKKFAFQAIVETGTFRGTTTKFIAQNSDAPVYTVEANLRVFYYAQKHLRSISNIHPRLGDSRAFLGELIADTDFPKQNIFFYLDAHWNADLPLYEEVEMIQKHWEDAVVMIDDFEVPDDDGYNFDDYGDGKKLCLAYLGADLLSQWSVYFPAESSANETGHKRGCVVLASKSLTDKLDQISTLRNYSVDSPAA